MKKIAVLLVIPLFLMACKPAKKNQVSEMQKKVDQFAVVALNASTDSLSLQDKEMLRILFKVACIMDDIFWEQAYGKKADALKLTEDSATMKFIEINYGPWERLNDNKPFIEGIGEKPLGAGFYPTNMTKEEFEKFEAADKTSLYTIIRRNKAGQLESVPYHIAYKEKIEAASLLLKQAAGLAEDPGFKKYLELRSEALLTDDYLASDLAWMDMKTNKVDFVVGPIENYEDQLYGYKASFEAYILLKDLDWSKKLEKFAAYLPELQKRLPVDTKYKAESPGSSSDLGAYDVVYYAGDCNAGSKTIAINLPNDPEVQRQKGSRRIQLKNAMKAKFDKILFPISQEMIVPEQQQYVNFDAFFENTMFHEVAHGLGMHHVISNKTITVSDALKENGTTLEEGKADILGLFLVDELLKMKEINSTTYASYTTFTAGIFRSIRFGAASAHGKANLLTYNYFMEKEAFSRNANGQYTVNYEKMSQAIALLAADILMVQGNGDYDAAVKFLEKYGSMSEQLNADLDKINQKSIPVDIVFEQGPEMLDLLACTPKNCKSARHCSSTCGK